MNEPTLQKPPRVWPGVLIVFLQWVARYGVPHFVPEALPFGVVSGFAGGLLVVVWWVFVSRAPWSERVGAVVLMVIALAATPRFLDVSMATAGQGMLFYMYAIPFLSLAFVAWAVATRRLTGGARWVSMAATILLACGVWTLLRTGGITATFIRISRGGGRRLRKSVFSRTLRTRWPSRPRRRPQRKPTGLDFADPGATASSPACASRPTGPSRHPSSCGAGRSTGMVVFRGERRPPIHARATR